MRSAYVKVEVLNIDSTVDKYVVARLVGGSLWYWGSWADRKTAHNVASQFDNGVVLEYNDIEVIDLDKEV